MNLPPITTRTPEFQELDEQLNGRGLLALFHIGAVLQSTRAVSVRLRDKRSLRRLADLNCDLDDEVIWSALVGSWLLLVPGSADLYEVPFFLENNRQMISNWENGRQKQAKATQAKAIQNQLKATQPNPTQFNSDAGGIAWSVAPEGRSSIAGSIATPSANGRQITEAEFDAHVASSKTRATKPSLGGAF